MRSIFRYPGGKSKVSSLILRYMPDDIKEYREAFVGGGGVYFALSSIKSRWINDTNIGLMSVYLSLRDNSVDFIKRCREIAPHRVGEEEVSTKGTGKRYNRRLGEVFSSFSYNEEMDQGLRYFFLNRTVWGGRVNYNPEFKSRMYYSNPSGWNIVHRAGFLESASSHISGTKITTGDYSLLMSGESDGVWVYLDPPYIVDTGFNKGSKLYEFGFSWEDHARFVQCCKETRYKIAISYDDKPEVRDWFKEKDGFRIYPHSWIYSGSSLEKKLTGKEVIITNYDRDERRFYNNRMGDIS